MPDLLQSEERVLSTLETDGSRRWLKPKLSQGVYLQRRRLVAYALIAIYLLLPHLHWNGTQLFQLDIWQRRFTFFGYTFLPTDTVLLALFGMMVFVSIFLVTALFGRLWCGWACPQTVYLEFVYRPLERLFEGTAGKGGRARNVPVWRKAAMYATYLLISFVLANTFIAYFVGRDNVLRWMTGSPFDHPLPFAVMAVTTALMLFDFAYFREQLCILACPYGRFQSVLLDRNSLIVSYDAKRGEPRGKYRKNPPPDAAPRGDCIDCHACVTTCPTGIDIRNGLQMECINCTQCMDACDKVMEKIGRAKQLIRYSSQAQDEGEAGTWLRPRVFLYPAILLVLAGLFVGVLVTKQDTDLNLFRSIGTPYKVTDAGMVISPVRLKITNRQQQPRTYTIEPVTDKPVTLLQGGTVEVPADAARTAQLPFQLPPAAFTDGVCEIRLRVHDGADYERTITCRLLGPYSSPETANAP